MELRAPGDDPLPGGEQGRREGLAGFGLELVPVQGDDDPSGS
jgi:hypothetical protein